MPDELTRTATPEEMEEIHTAMQNAMRELKEQAAEQRRENAPEVPATLKRHRGLDGRDLDAWFAADTPAKTISFTIGGNGARLVLRKVGAVEAQSLQNRFARLAVTTGEEQEREGFEAAVVMLAKTVRSGWLWRKDGEEWKRVDVPEEETARLEFFRSWHALENDAALECWEGLVWEAMALYGFTEESQGN